MYMYFRVSSAKNKNCHLISLSRQFPDYQASPDLSSPQVFVSDAALFSDKKNENIVLENRRRLLSSAQPSCLCSPGCWTSSSVSAPRRLHQTLNTQTLSPEGEDERW